MNCLCVVLALVISQPKSKPKTPEPRVDLRCGGYCLYAGLSALDVPLGDYAALEKSLGEPSTLGYSMEQLARAARSRGAFALGVETNLDNLASRPGRFAGIALLDDAKHYACIYDVDDKSVFIVDPPLRREIARDAFSLAWRGNALILSAKDIVPVSPRRSNMPWLGAIATACLLLAIGVRVRSLRCRTIA